MLTQYWKEKNIFVTGATGLLGPTLVKDLLSQQANVFVLIRDAVPNSLFFQESLDKKVNLVFGDLLDFNLLQRVLNEFDINTVFHLGAQAIVGIANRSPISTFRSNIEGTWNLLEACRLSPWIKKIVVASSDKAYGAQKVLPYTEEAPMQGRHPYDVSKSCTDLISQSYFHTYKLPVCVTRCGNFFGPGDLHFNRIIPGTIWSVLNNQRPVIRSNGLFVRDYIYVKDVAHAYMTLAKKMDDASIVGECFNFSTDQPFNVLEIVDLILEVMDRKDLQPIILNQANNEIPEQHLSSAKARKDLGWETKFGVKVGMQETVQWYRDFFGKRTKHDFICPNNIKETEISG
jgi:CDP-glucose 4,6-dehydratase